MATLDNERYLRHILLLGEGGLLVLRGIVTKEAASRFQTLEHILATNRALFQNLIKEQYRKLFPSTSTVNADVQTWDMSLLMVVVKRLFLSGLSSADTSSFKTLKACRIYIQGHPTSMNMSATDYTTNRLLLKTALLQLASGISADTDTEIKDIIRRTESGHIDIHLSLRHIKELHEFKTSFLEALESKFSVLTDMNRRLNGIETCLNNMDGNHAVRYGALQTQLQNIDINTEATNNDMADMKACLDNMDGNHAVRHGALQTQLQEIDITTGATKNDMADMKAQQAKTSRLVEKILKMKINDCTRSTKNALQTIIEAKCDQKQKQKDACVLLFEFVEMIQNQDDFSKEEIKQIIEQWVQYHGDLCLELVDELIRWFTDMRNIPDAVPGNATLGCIRIPIKCSSMKGMLKHLEYMNSDECKQRLSEISCSLSKMLGFSCCLSWTIVPDSLQIVMKTLSKELETHDPTSETVKIVLPFQSKSLKGLTNIWTIFEGEESNSHLTKVSETLSKIVGANVSVTASVVMDQFTKAVYERSKDNISSSTDTKVQGQEQLGNIQDGGNISDESTVDRKDAAQGNTEMHISPSSEFFKEDGNISDESTVDRKDATLGTTEMDISQSSESFKVSEDRKTANGNLHPFNKTESNTSHVVKFNNEVNTVNIHYHNHETENANQHSRKDNCKVDLNTCEEHFDLRTEDGRTKHSETGRVNKQAMEVPKTRSQEVKDSEPACQDDATTPLLRTEPDLDCVKTESPDQRQKPFVTYPGRTDANVLHKNDRKGFEGEGLKRNVDDTFTQSLMTRLNNSMESCGALIYKGNVAGTVFRVGYKYVMTAFHVIQCILINQRGGSDFDFSRIDDCPDVFVNFMESVCDSPHQRFRVKVTYVKEDIDVTVLELVDFTGNVPPSLLLWPHNASLLGHRSVSVAGFGHEKSPYKKHLETCPILTYLQVEDRFKAAHAWLEDNRQECINDIRRNEKDHTSVDRGYAGYDNENIIKLDCFMGKGLSGGPILTNDANSVKVIGMVIGGKPEFYYNLSPQKQVSFPYDYRFAFGVKMPLIFTTILSENSALARDIFLDKKTRPN